MISFVLFVFSLSLVFLMVSPFLFSFFLLFFCCVCFFFFFSSRRRHTRLQGDWSSDVCSSDLNRQCKIFGVQSLIKAPYHLSSQQMNERVH